MFKDQIKSLVVTSGSCLIAATVFLGVISGTAKADDIIFHDLFQGIPTVEKIPLEGTVTESISVEEGPTCIEENCSITIRGENNFNLASTGTTFGFTTVDSNHFYWTILEPDSTISDVVLLDTTHANETDLGATLSFLSDGPGVDFSGFQIAAGSPVEDGTNQQILSLTWQDTGSPVADTANIFVASDTPDVPEPRSVMLLGTSLVLLGGAYRRRVRSGSKIS